MQYRPFGKIADRVSALGLGCMRIPGEKTEDGWRFDEDLAVRMIRHAIDSGVNYIDTAYTYSDSQNERIVGKALADGYRDRVMLTTKLPHWACESADDFSRIFEEQLARLGTDHLDVYLLHALHGDSWEKMRDLGAIPFMEKLKAEGRIRHIGFSFHGTYDELVRILDEYPHFEVVQLQFNYLDVEEQAGERGIRLCGERGIPVIVMEGLRGGNLAKVPANVQAVFDNCQTERSPAEWAFRFLADYPEIATVLSGMTSLDMIDDNVRIFSDAAVGCLSDDEKAMMASAREAYKSRVPVNCTGCHYCKDCPAGIAIPSIFSLWSHCVMFDVREDGIKSYKKRIAEGTDASQCIGCHACEEICPQNIMVADRLREADAYLRP